MARVPSALLNMFNASFLCFNAEQTSLQTNYLIGMLYDLETRRKR